MVRYLLGGCLRLTQKCTSDRRLAYRPLFLLTCYVADHQGRGYCVVAHNFSVINVLNIKTPICGSLVISILAALRNCVIVYVGF